MPNPNNFQLFNTTKLDFTVAESTINKVIKLFTQRHSCTIEFVEIVLVDEEEIRRINREYLQKDYVTDVISFHYHDSNETKYTLITPALEGTMYCCLPRIIEQSTELDVDVSTECLRIVVHGLLHILGYEDSTLKQKETMTKEEEAIIQQITI
tara:strand:+ start:3118 stop:3576 length:459 start_codon:yes stop_codon:yes gene_type:complete